MIPKTFPGDKFYKSCYNINDFETWQVSVGTWHLDSGTWHLDLRFADLHQATKLACTRSSAISEEELKGCADTIHGRARTDLQSTRHKEKNTQRTHSEHTCTHTGLHKLWYPGIRDTSTWSKFGAHGEHGDVFLFSNLGAL